MDNIIYEFDFEEQEDIEEIMNGISYLHHGIILVRDLLSMVDGLSNKSRINIKDLLGYFMNLEMITNYRKQQLDYQVSSKDNQIKGIVVIDFHHNYSLFFYGRKNFAPKKTPDFRYKKRL